MPGVNVQVVHMANRKLRPVISFPSHGRISSRLAMGVGRPKKRSGGESKAVNDERGLLAAVESYSVLAC